MRLTDAAQVDADPGMLELAVFLGDIVDSAVGYAGDQVSVARIGGQEQDQGLRQAGGGLEHALPPRYAASVGRPGAESFFSGCEQRSVLAERQAVEVAGGRQGKFPDQVEVGIENCDARPVAAAGDDQATLPGFQDRMAVRKTGLVEDHRTLSGLLVIQADAQLAAIDQMPFIIVD